MADLVTLEQVKDALGLKPAETAKDSVILDALPQVTDSIQQFTRRTFDLNVPANPATPRTFAVEEGGVITIDDAVHGTVTAVSVVDAYGTPTALSAPAYVVLPYSGEFPVAWYLDMPSVGLPSPAMGFARNMDVLAAEGRLYRGAVQVTVTAKWGWPSVPGAVQRAAIWTTVSFIDNPRPYVSEAISGYSRTMANPQNEGIPSRARDLLGPYVKS